MYVALSVSILYYYAVLPDEYDSDTNSNGRMGIFTEGFKSNKRVCVLEHMMFIVRRSLLVFILVFGWNNGLFQAYFFLVSCFVTLVFKLVVRPYSQAILNVQDIIFELILIAIISILLSFSSEGSELADSGVYHILGLICLGLMGSIMIINYIITICTMVRR